MFDGDVTLKKCSTRSKSGAKMATCTMTFVDSNFAGIGKFKYERKNEMNSGSIDKMRPSCKWLL